MSATEKGYRYNGYNRCYDCMVKVLKEKDIRDENELKWIFKGADQLGGRMNKWPVRDQEGDYVKIDMRRLRASLDDETPELIYNLHMGVQLYYEDWRPLSDDPAVQIDEDIEVLDEEDYEDDGLDCESCGGRLWGPIPLYCVRHKCENKITEGGSLALALKDNYLYNERLCENHYCEMMLAFEDPVIAEIAALNRENPSRDYDDFLDRIVSDDLHVVFRHFLALLTVYDEVEQTPRWHIVQTIKRVAEQEAYDKPFDIFEFDIEKTPAFEFAPPD